MDHKGVVRIDWGACIGCGICALECNHDVLTVENGKAKVRHERYCNHCGHCVAICPQGAPSLDGVLRPLEGKEEISPQDLLLLMARRRSVRRFKDRAVPREVIKELVEAAAVAPTGCNNRSPHYTVMDRPREVEELGRWFQDRSGPLTAAWGHSLVQGILKRLPLKGARRVSNPRLVRGMETLRTAEDPHRNWITLGAPALVIISAPHGEVTPREDCLIAATHMVLMAESMGLGTCFSGVLADLLALPSPWKKKLALPGDHGIFAVLCLGYPSVPMRRGLLRPPAALRFVE